MNDLIFTQLAEEFKGMVERILKEERQKYLEENKNTRANGYYTRTPKTIFGDMELNIPRTRDSKFKSSVFPERKRITFMLDEIVDAMFKSGISSRKTGKVVENLFGCSVSSQYISRISDISQKVIDAFRNRKIENDYPILYIDATYIPIRRDSVEKEAVYAVLGLRSDGKRSILAYHMPGGDEKASMWHNIFEDLRKRGLKDVRMIISDDLKGLSKSIEETFPQAKHQLCWFHLKKNIKNRVRKRHWDEILNELNEISDSKNKEEAEEKLEEFVEKWSRIYKSISNLKNKIDHYTHFFNFPRKIRGYFSTTNWMERCFKELKDSFRIRGYFHSENSAEKFLYLFFKDKDSKYQERKLRYSDIIREVFE